MVQWRERLHMEVEPAPYPARPPVFVIGCMRSGTTFLADKLSEHPQILKVGNELRQLWTEFGGAPCGELENTRRTAADFNPDALANMSSYFARYVTNARSFRRHLMRLRYRVRHGRGRVFYDWQNVIPLNKSTRLVNKIGYVNALFPKSKIIVIVREIGAHSASMKAFIDRMHRDAKPVFAMPRSSTSAWAQISAEDSDTDRYAATYPPSFHAIPEMWLRLNMLALTDLEALPSADYRVVRYEDLVTSPAACFEMLFDFLELNDNHRREARAIASSPTSVTDATSDGNLLSGWETSLTRAERSAIEEVQSSEEYRRVEQLLSGAAFTI